MNYSETSMQTYRLQYPLNSLLSGSEIMLVPRLLGSCTLVGSGAWVGSIWSPMSLHSSSTLWCWYWDWHIDSMIQNGRHIQNGGSVVSAERWGISVESIRTVTGVLLQGYCRMLRNFSRVRAVKVEGLLQCFFGHGWEHRLLEIIIYFWKLL